MELIGIEERFDDGAANIVSCLLGFLLKNVMCVSGTEGRGLTPVIATLLIAMVRVRIRRRERPSHRIGRLVLRDVEVDFYIHKVDVTQDK